MSNGLPESVDAWRTVTARRIFQGRIGLDTMPRLAESLADTAGECEYWIGFDRDELGVAFLELRAEATLPLVCQRTLNRFELPVTIGQRLGLIRDEREEAALPEGYEPVLVPADGALRLADMIEDELILAVPVVPLSEHGLLVDDMVWQEADTGAAGETAAASPFAVLARLKANG